jgi:hypothetical protein
MSVNFSRVVQLAQTPGSPGGAKIVPAEYTSLREAAVRDILTTAPHVTLAQFELWPMPKSVNDLATVAALEGVYAALKSAIPARTFTEKLSDSIGFTPSTKLRLMRNIDRADEVLRQRKFELDAAQPVCVI